MIMNLLFFPPLPNSSSLAVVVKRLPEELVHSDVPSCAPTWRPLLTTNSSLIYEDQWPLAQDSGNTSWMMVWGETQQTPQRNNQKGIVLRVGSLIVTEPTGWGRSCLFGCVTSPDRFWFPAPCTSPVFLSLVDFTSIIVYFLSFPPCVSLSSP